MGREGGEKRRKEGRKTLESVLLLSRQLKFDPAKILGEPKEYTSKLSTRGLKRKHLATSSYFLWSRSTSWDINSLKIPSCVYKSGHIQCLRETFEQKGRSTQSPELRSRGVPPPGSRLQQHWLNQEGHEKRLLYRCFTAEQNLSKLRLFHFLHPQLQNIRPIPERRF